MIRHHIVKCSISFEILPGIDQTIYTVIIIIIGSTKSKCQNPRVAAVVLWWSHIYWWYFEHSLFHQNILLYPWTWGRLTGLWLAKNLMSSFVTEMIYFLKDWDWKCIHVPTKCSPWYLKLPLTMFVTFDTEFLMNFGYYCRPLMANNFQMDH